MSSWTNVASVVGGPPFTAVSSFVTQRGDSFAATVEKPFVPWEPNPVPPECGALTYDATGHSFDRCTAPVAAGTARCLRHGECTCESVEPGGPRQSLVCPKHDGLIFVKAA